MSIMLVRKNRWLMVLGVTVVLTLVAFYVALWLTGGNLGDFFRHQAWGSMLYANMWEHILRGNMLVDAKYAPGEYFVTGPERLVVYFGIMPVLIRALSNIVLSNNYTYNLSNLSMVIASLVAVGSVGYASFRLAHGDKKLYLLAASLCTALLVASPLVYLIVWGWTYHEVILWGLAWALLFTSLYALWVFDKAGRSRWQGIFMGLAVGCAVLCRPTIGFTLIVPYLYICTRSALQAMRHKNSLELRLLWPSMIVVCVLASIALLVNYERWGSATTFVRIDQNVQFVERFPERAVALKKAGEFNIDRMPTSLYYYLIPSGGNFQHQYPFVTLDRELTGMDRAPQYDYIEGSRVPVTLSMTFLLAIAGFGMYGLWKFGTRERIAGAWLLIGALLTLGLLATVYAVALRYSAELLPPFVFLGLAYIAATKRKLTSSPGRVTIILFAVLFVFSAYATTVTALAYKGFVWDIPASQREFINKQVPHASSGRDTPHIINGERFTPY